VQPRSHNHIHIGLRVGMWARLFVDFTVCAPSTAGTKVRQGNHEIRVSGPNRKPKKKEKIRIYSRNIGGCRAAFLCQCVVYATAVTVVSRPIRSGSMRDRLARLDVPFEDESGRRGAGVLGTLRNLRPVFAPEG
jgi:hypothetical protein